MSALVNLTLFGWIPFVLILFMLLPSRRAVICSFLIAWLFLPMYQFKLVGFLPNYDKVSATCLGTFLATAIFDSGRFMSFRPKWYDLPMLLWCLVPLPSALSTGLGAYEGLSGVMYQTIAWGLPYFIGRVYFNSLEGLHELALGLIIGGIVYVPLCLYEIRMSPQLHNMVYGFHQHDFGQSKRGGGWRPTVFMQHGLAVATFVCTASLMALWVSISEKRRAFFGVPLVVFALVMLVTAVLCKSSGATLLMLTGLATLVFVRVTRLAFPAWILLSIPCIYIFARTIGGWDASIVTDLAKAISPRALQSVQFRLNNENALWQEVRPTLLLGATRFRWSDIDPELGRTIIPDGLWILALGRFGLVGLFGVFSCFAIPVIAFLGRFRASQWNQPQVAVAAGWAVCISLWAIDCLSNAMADPIFLLAAGGLAAAPAVLARTVAAGRPTPRPLAPTPVVFLPARDSSTAPRSSIPARLSPRSLPPTPNTP